MRNFRLQLPGEVLVHTAPDFLQEAFARLRPLLRPALQGGYETSRVFLILDEVLSNVYRHGYRRANGQPIGIRLRVEGERCRITVRDLAPPFDSVWHGKRRSLPAPESGSPGGRGLVIMVRMCQSMQHRMHAEGGNELDLVMKMLRRSAPERPGASGETVCSTEEDDGVAENR